MSKPKGLQSVRKAVSELFPIMPERFYGIHLVRLVAKRIGRPEVYQDSIFRKMRELKEEGLINFVNTDKLHSIYEKRPLTDTQIINR
jgi:hypothetical protein